MSVNLDGFFSAEQTQNASRFDHFNNWLHNNSTTLKVLKVVSLILGISLVVSLPFTPAILAKKVTATAVLSFASAIILLIFERILTHYKPHQSLAIPSKSSTIPSITLTEEQQEKNSSTPVSSPLSDKVKVEPTSTPSLQSIPLKENPLSKKLRALNDAYCKGNLCGVYISTNEEGVSDIRQAINQIPTVPQSCHIGFSGWYNFDIMTMRKSTYGIICDFNPHNKIFIEKTLEILRRSLDRESFVEEMSCFVKEIIQDRIKKVNTPAYDDCLQFSLNVNTDCNDEMEEIRNELTREGSWLATNEGFQYIKNLAFKDQITAITINITDTDRFQSIAKILRDNSIEMDSLYLSNICNYMGSNICNDKGLNEKKAFAATVNALIKPDTIVINCPANQTSKNLSDNTSPVQKMFLGKTFATSSDDEKLFKI